MKIALLQKAETVVSACKAGVTVATRPPLMSDFPHIAIYTFTFTPNLLSGVTVVTKPSMRMGRDARQLPHEKLLLLLEIAIVQGFELTTLAVDFAIRVFILLLHDCLRHMDVVQ